MLKLRFPAVKSGGTDLAPATKKPPTAVPLSKPPVIGLSASPIKFRTQLTLAPSPKQTTNGDVSCFVPREQKYGPARLSPTTSSMLSRSPAIEQVPYFKRLTNIDGREYVEYHSIKETFEAVGSRKDFADKVIVSMQDNEVHSVELSSLWANRANIVNDMFEGIKPHHVPMDGIAVRVNQLPSQRNQTGPSGRKSKQGGIVVWYLACSKNTWRSDEWKAKPTSEKCTTRCQAYLTLEECQKIGSNSSDDIVLRLCFPKGRCLHLNRENSGRLSGTARQNERKKVMATIVLVQCLKISS